MWHISTITGPGSDGARIVGGVPGNLTQRQLGDRLGPQGARYFVITNSGVITLEDIGDIQAPGAGLDWGIRLGNTQSIYYGGEGEISIQLDGAGSAQVVAGGQSATTPVLSPVIADFTIQPENKQCGFVAKTITGPETITFTTGLNEVATTFMIQSPIDGVIPPGIDLSVTRSDGLVINSGTTSSQNTYVSVVDGCLVFAQQRMGGAWTYTLTVANPLAVPCNIIVIMQSDSQHQDSVFYQQLAVPTQTLLISLGILPPLPSGFQPNWFWDNWPCTICQAQFYAAIGVFALTAPEVFATITYRRMAGWFATAEFISTVAEIVKNVFQVNDGLAGQIANAIVTIADPLAWPKAICEAEGICH
jgi:hypothetical protein